MKVDLTPFGYTPGSEYGKICKDCEIVLVFVSEKAYRCKRCAKNALVKAVKEKLADLEKWLDTYGLGDD